MKQHLLLTLLFLLCFAGTTKDKHNPFSQMEREHIRVATPGLFSRQKTIYLDYENYTDNDYSFPLPNGKVISRYGRGNGAHSGIDIKSWANDTIFNCFDGVVRMAKNYSGYGLVIVVRHYNGLETVYSHNSKNFVTSGDSVKAGQAIALTGRTGRATTEHLHFETRINGQHFNPNIIFDFEQKKLRKEKIKCTVSGNNVVVKPVLKK